MTRWESPLTGGSQLVILSETKDLVFASMEEQILRGACPERKTRFFAEFILSDKTRFFGLRLRMTQRRAQNDTAKGSE